MLSPVMMSMLFRSSSKLLIKGGAFFFFFKSHWQVTAQTWSSDLRGMLCPLPGTHYCFSKPWFRTPVPFLKAICIYYSLCLSLTAVAYLNF